MARYVLVMVDNNEVADRLRYKLDRVSGIKVVGMFAKPTKFCEGKCQVGNPNARSITGKKFGWRLCPVCHKPRRTFHYLKNLIAPDVPVRFWDTFLQINEPWDNDPEGKYGATTIENVRQAGYLAGLKIDRRSRRRARKHQVEEPTYPNILNKKGKVKDGK
jgi:hypothetical protein